MYGEAYWIEEIASGTELMSSGNQFGGSDMQVPPYQTHAGAIRRKGSIWLWGCWITVSAEGLSCRTLLLPDVEVEAMTITRVETLMLSWLCPIPALRVTFTDQTGNQDGIDVVGPLTRQRLERALLHSLGPHVTFVRRNLWPLWLPFLAFLLADVLFHPPWARAAFCAAYTSAVLIWLFYGKQSAVIRQGEGGVAATNMKQSSKVAS